MHDSSFNQLTKALSHVTCYHLTSSNTISPSLSESVASPLSLSLWLHSCKSMDHQMHFGKCSSAAARPSKEHASCQFRFRENPLTGAQAPAYLPAQCTHFNRAIPGTLFRQSNYNQRCSTGATENVQLHMHIRKVKTD